MTGAASEFYFPTHCDAPLGKAASHCAVTELQVRAYGEQDTTVLQLELDGRALPALTIRAGWADYTVPLPQDLGPAMHLLHIAHDAADGQIAVGEILIR
jgi:hypothetical protein